MMRIAGIRVLDRLHHISRLWVIVIGAFIWLGLITTLHFTVNNVNEQRKVITMGYMPVISNLAVPILDYASKESGNIRFRALKYASFAEMAESLRNGKIDVAFMIAPLSIVLRQQGEDVKVVYIGNRHESTLVTRKDLNIESLEDLVGKTIAVPMRYSGHNISILNLLADNGLDGSINVVEMNPPDMAVSLVSGSLDAYYVGEPFAAQTLMSGDASRLFYVEEVWDKFICNLAVVRQDLIENKPKIVKQLVQAAARSGLWAQKNPHQAAEIASKYWGQPVNLVEYALTKPQGRIVYDQFVPKEHEMKQMADLMTKHNLLNNNEINGLIDSQFAESANLQNISTINSIIERY